MLIVGHFYETPVSEQFDPVGQAGCGYETLVGWFSSGGVCGFEFLNSLYFICVSSRYTFYDFVILAFILWHIQNAWACLTMCIIRTLVDDRSLLQASGRGYSKYSKGCWCEISTIDHRRYNKESMATAMLVFWSLFLHKELFKRKAFGLRAIMGNATSYCTYKWTITNSVPCNKTLDSNYIVNKYICHIITISWPYSSNTCTCKPDYIIVISWQYTGFACHDIAAITLSGISENLPRRSKKLWRYCSDIAEI